MAGIHNFVAAADLLGLAVYLGVMGTFLGAVAWATFRDCQNEARKKHALAAKALLVPAMSKDVWLPKTHETEHRALAARHHPPRAQSSAAAVRAL